MTDSQPLTERDSYRQGRRDYAEGRGDFRRRSYFGDERRAYMLGRLHAAREAQKRQREWVAAPFGQSK